MNASLNSLDEPVHISRKLVLDSRDINAISAFVQKRIRLPKEFLLDKARTLDISEDARTIIYILLDGELDSSISEDDREAFKEIAANFSLWVSSTA
jgi:hypothetical protein